MQTRTRAGAARRQVPFPGVMRCPAVRGWLGMAAASLSLASCVSYRMISPQHDPTPGTQVRATLTGPGALRVSGFFGRPVQSLEGEFLGAAADSLLLGVQRLAGFGVQNMGHDTLAVARTDIALLHERRLSAARTALAVGASSVAIGAVAVGLFRAAGGSGGEDGDDGDRMRIPIFFRPK